MNFDVDDLKIPVTRFPPEPNGYLHLGHAKSIKFGFVKEYLGCYLPRVSGDLPQIDFA